MYFYQRATLIYGSSWHDSEGWRGRGVPILWNRMWCSDFVSYEYACYRVIAFKSLCPRPGSVFNLFMQSEQRESSSWDICSVLPLLYICSKTLHISHELGSLWIPAFKLVAEVRLSDLTIIMQPCTLIYGAIAPLFLTLSTFSTQPS